MVGKPWRAGRIRKMVDCLVWAHRGREKGRGEREREREDREMGERKREGERKVRTGYKTKAHPQ